MTATLFDSHAHVDGPEFDADRDAVLARARAAGVRRIVVIGAVGEPSSAERAVALAERDPNIWATVATHPHDVDEDDARVVGGARTPRTAPARRRDRRDRARLLLRPLAAPGAARGVRPVHRARPHGRQAGRLPYPGRARRTRSRSCATTARPSSAASSTASPARRTTRAPTPSSAATCRSAASSRTRPPSPSATRSRSCLATACWSRPIARTSPRSRSAGRRNEPAYVVHTAEVVARCAGMSFRGVSRGHDRERASHLSPAGSVTCGLTVPPHAGIDCRLVSEN